MEEAEQEMIRKLKPGVRHVGGEETGGAPQKNNPSLPPAAPSIFFFFRL